ncbi:MULTISPECIES: hypothetical protein [unclassified Herbaspirillum]|uniref:hypothetical protein n=1 Tax=unclassified Herbaspirillum TaxID=2624150 RepID=UPI0011533ADC|nr:MULTISPECIES: hypothetical protein [unclassified Herbaspirillum]MBB5390867.1 hypothetical protein [Herbaspirillum sp. SJZ102]
MKAAHYRCRPAAIRAAFFDADPAGGRLLIYTSAMLKPLIFCIKLAIVFAAIVFFGKAVQYLIFNGGFSGEFFDYVFFRKT